MKRLLLVGGGHSHVEVVRRFGLTPPVGAEVMLVSSEPRMAYSGMLPGYIAGHYALTDIHIDLERLCRRAGARFVPAEAAGLDLAGRTIHYRDGGTAGFDVLSLDIGSTPDVSAPGASAYAVAVKPVPRLLSAWERVMAAARLESQSIVIVGGGAGGVELALAMEHRMRTQRMRATVALVTDASTILPGHPLRAGRTITEILQRRAIALHAGSRVESVEPRGLRLHNGERLAASWIVWATSASAAPWLAASGLATDARGFVSVDEELRSTSHPFVFASGDCAHLEHHSLPKSGVYAVRQGPVLAGNLRNAARDAPLQRFHPQRRSLSLISTGDRHAVATWGPVSFSGGWVWRWKDRTDRRFVATYHAAARSA